MKQSEFVSYLLELLAPIGAVSARAMFGGFGIYHDGVMFGLVADDTLYLKVDKENRQEFVDEGAEAFVYEGKGKSISMSYFRCPEAALDSPAAMLPWARSSIGAALRARGAPAAKKVSRRPRADNQALDAAGARLNAPTAIALNRLSYDTIATQWDAARQTLSAPEQRLLKRFSAKLSVGGRVLDLGCGSGQPIAAHLLGQGLQVTGIDQSVALLEIAKQRFPNGDWRHHAIEKYVPKQTFDGIVAWDSLFHLPRALHARVLGRLRRALARGGPLLLTLGGSAHPAFTDTMWNQPFFYDAFPPEQAEELLRTTGFEIELNEFLDQPDLDDAGQARGRDKGRIVILARAG
jgi:TfoX/Sxy family transcriptional regulator of competence genes/protein-L-isoaspartate O-methyltransferase